MPAAIPPSRDVGRVLWGPGPEHRRQGRIASRRGASPAVGPVGSLLRTVLEIDAHHALAPAGEREGMAEAGIGSDDKGEVGPDGLEHVLEMEGRAGDRSRAPGQPRQAERWRIHAVEFQEPQHRIVVRQIDPAFLIERGIHRAPRGDEVRRIGRPAPGQTAQISRLHEECVPALAVQRGDHWLAMAVAPGAMDSVQRHPVAQQDSVGRARTGRPVGEIAPALPEVGERRRQRAGGAQRERRRRWRGVAALLPEHVEE